MSYETRGGARPGAGRKPKPPAAKARRVNITMTAAEHSALAELRELYRQEAGRDTTDSAVIGACVMRTYIAARSRGLTRWPDMVDQHTNEAHNRPVTR